MEVNNTADTFLLTTPSYENGGRHYDTDNSSINSPTDLSHRSSAESVDREEQFYDAHSESLSRFKTTDENDIDQFADTECDSDDSSPILTKLRHHRLNRCRKSIDNFRKVSIDSDNNSETKVGCNAEVSSVVQQEAVNNESNILTNCETRDTSSSRNISLEEMSSGTDNNDHDATNNEKVDQNSVTKSTAVDKNESSVHNEVEMYYKDNDKLADSTSAIDSIEKFGDLNDDHESIDKIVSDTVANILKNATFSSEDDESLSSVACKKRLKTKRFSSKIAAESDSLDINPPVEFEKKNNFDENNEIKTRLTMLKSQTVSKKMNRKLSNSEKPIDTDEWMSVDPCYQCKIVLHRINVEEELDLLIRKKAEKGNNVRSKRKRIRKQHTDENYAEITNNSEVNGKKVEKPNCLRGRRRKTNKMEKKLSGVAEEIEIDAEAKTRSTGKRGRPKKQQKKPTENHEKAAVQNRTRCRREKTPQISEEKLSRTVKSPDEEVINIKKEVPSRACGRRSKPYKTTPKKSPRNIKSSISSKAERSSDEEPMVTSQVLLTNLSGKKSTQSSKHSAIKSEKETQTVLSSPRKRVISFLSKSDSLPQPRSKLPRTKFNAKSTATGSEAFTGTISDRFVTGVCLQRMSAEMIESYTKSSQASNTNSKQTFQTKSTRRTKVTQKLTNSDAENVTNYSPNDDSCTKSLKKSKRIRKSVSEKKDSNVNDIDTTSSQASRETVAPTLESKLLIEKSSSKAADMSKTGAKMKSFAWEKSNLDENNVEIKSKAQKKIYSDKSEVENKLPIKIKIASDESLWEKFIQSETKTDRKSPEKIADNDEELKTESREFDSDKTNTKNVKKKPFKSINLSSSDEESTSFRSNSSRSLSKSPERNERAKRTVVTRSRQYSSSSEDEKLRKNSNDWCESLKLKPREAKIKSKMKLCDAFSDEESDKIVKRRRSNSASSNESDWKLKVAKGEYAESSNDSSSNGDESWKNKKSKSKTKVPKKTTKNRTRGRKSKKPNEKEKTLKKMVTLCGLTINSYNGFWGDCETIEEKTQRIHEFLREKGLQDQLSIRNCEKFGFARRGLKLIDLGSNKSDDESHDTRHSESSEEDIR